MFSLYFIFIYFIQAEGSPEAGMDHEIRMDKQGAQNFLTNAFAYINEHMKGENENTLASIMGHVKKLDVQIGQSEKDVLRRQTDKKTANMIKMAPKFFAAAKHFLGSNWWDKQNIWSVVRFIKNINKMTTNKNVLPTDGLEQESQKDDTGVQSLQGLSMLLEATLHFLNNKWWDTQSITSVINFIRRIEALTFGRNNQNKLLPNDNKVLGMVGNLGSTLMHFLNSDWWDTQSLPSVIDFIKRVEAMTENNLRQGKRSRVLRMIRKLWKTLMHFLNSDWWDKQSIPSLINFIKKVERLALSMGENGKGKGRILGMVKKLGETLMHFLNSDWWDKQTIPSVINFIKRIERLALSIKPTNGLRQDDRAQQRMIERISKLLQQFVHFLNSDWWDKQSLPSLTNFINKIEKLTSGNVNQAIKELIEQNERDESEPVDPITSFSKLFWTIKRFIDSDWWDRQSISSLIHLLKRIERGSFTRPIRRPTQ